MLSIIDLTKKFGSFTAVNSLNLTVMPGDIYGFLGPNGAGKTTTIKIAAGLYSPSKGKVLINGMDNQEFPIETKSLTGYVPDQPFLYDKLTGREFLYFSAGLYKMDKNSVRSRVNNLIDELNIGTWIDKRTEEYSQGMRQRIAIASSFLHSPKLILLDEPMAGLDPQTAVLVKNLLKRTAEEGAAVLLSTHSLAVAEEVCTKVAVLKEGQIIFDDKKEAVDQFKEKLKLNFESFFLELTK